MGNKQSRHNGTSQWPTSSCSHEDQLQSQECISKSSYSTPSSLGSQSQLSHTVLVKQQQSSTQSQPSRVLVDIRGANLDASKYAVWVEKQPRRQRAQHAAEALEGGFTVCSAALQAIGGLFVTVLTIQKLVEEIKLIRGLRKSNSKSADGKRDGKTHKPATTSMDAAFSLPRPLAKQLRHSPCDTKAVDNVGIGAEGIRSSCCKQQSAWSDVAGLQHVKMLLQEVTVLPLVRPDLFRGVRSPPSAVLLYGPPGTGKTLLAKAVAAASGASFFTITGSSVLSKWYGESEQNVRRLFEEAAAAAPSVIFIDEVDSLLAKRGAVDGPGGSGEASRRVTNEFLAFIDGIATSTAGHGISGSNSTSSQASCAAGRVVVIAATNAPWDLDEAALSRFTARMLVPLPDAAARQVILERSMLGVQHTLDQECFKRVAEQADGLSGRDLVAVCREASMRPMRELWGSRILEGEAPHHCQQHQQLVAAVKAALQQGASHKKLRRSLERWKRQTGALWCNVEEVMKAGQAAQEQQQQQQPPPQEMKGGHEQQLPVALQLQQLEGSPAWPCATQPVEQCHQNTTASSEHQQSSAEGAAEFSDNGVHPCSTPWGGSNASTIGHCKVHNSIGTQEVSDCSASSLLSHPVAVEDVSSHADNTLSDAASRGQGAGSGNDNRSSKGSSGKPSTWTLEDLMALPADAVRPVTVKDMQWALTQAGHVDALADKYDEWTRSYGSGDGLPRAGRGSWRYLPMYT